MPAPTSGLARVTIRAPRRRLDLAIPHQVPLAELLPELLRRAGEAPADLGSAASPPPGGWMLRRGDGASLLGESALAQQGVRDGDVLYLVPRNLTWPEPAYDDVVEEMAEGARQHGRSWDAATTRLFSLVAAGLVLLTGLAVLVAAGPDRTASGLAAAGVCTVLLVAGGLLSRGLGDGVAGAAASGFALPYAAAAGALLAAGDSTADRMLVGASALLLAAVIGTVSVGTGLRVFTAGVVTGAFGVLGALVGAAVTGPGAASILVVVVVAGIGLAPLAAVRLGRLPLPVVSSVPELIAAEHRPERGKVIAAVVRADEILGGLLLGICMVGLGSVAVLAATTGLAGPLLGGLASAALLLRARLFPTAAARLPLLGAGVVGLALTAALNLSSAGAATRLLGVALAVAAVAALLTTAATAHRRRGGGSPYLGRAADILDMATVVALAPVACAVLGLYGWVRGLGS